MGKHLQHSLSNPAHVQAGVAVSPTAIRYPFVKRVAVATDIKAGIPWREVAKRHAVSQDSIKRFLDDPDVQAVIDPQLVKARRESMANLYELRVEQALENISDEKLKASSAAALMIVAGTGTDKAAQIRAQQSHGIGVVDAVASVLQEVEALAKTRKELEAALVEMEDNAAHDAPVEQGARNAPQDSTYIAPQNGTLGEKL